MLPADAGSAPTAATLQLLSPVVSILLATVLLRDRPATLQWVGVACATAGATVATLRDGLPRIGESALVGSLLMVVMAGLYGCSMVLGLW